jgi:hypothetical protein
MLGRIQQQINEEIEMQSTTDQIITTLIESPLGRKAAAEFHAADVKQRQAKLDEIAAARADAANGSAGARQRLEVAVRKEREVQDALRAAENEVLNARGELLSFTSRANSIVSRIEIELRNSLPRETLELLRQFDGEMGELFERARHADQLRVEDRDTGKFVLMENSNKSKPIVEHYSNTSAIEKRLRTIQAVRRLAREQLPLEADVALISAKLNQLRASINGYECGGGKWKLSAAADEMLLIGNSHTGHGVPAPAASRKSTYDTRGITHLTTRAHPIGAAN